MSVPPREEDAVASPTQAGLHVLAGCCPHNQHEGRELFPEARPEKPRLGLLPWGQGRVPQCLRKNQS